MLSLLHQLLSLTYTQESKCSLRRVSRRVAHQIICRPASELSGSKLSEVSQLSSLGSELPASKHSSASHHQAEMHRPEPPLHLQLQSSRSADNHRSCQAPLDPSISCAFGWICKVLTFSVLCGRLCSAVLGIGRTTAVSFCRRRCNGICMWHGFLHSCILGRHRGDVATIGPAHGPLSIYGVPLEEPRQQVVSLCTACCKSACSSLRDRSRTFFGASGLVKSSY